MSDNIDQLEQRLFALGSLERQYEEQIAAMSEHIRNLRSENRSTEANTFADVREELRLALKQLKLNIANFEVMFYTAVRRARR